MHLKKSFFSIYLNSTDILENSIMILQRNIEYIQKFCINNYFISYFLYHISLILINPKLAISLLCLMHKNKKHFLYVTINNKNIFQY